MNDAELWAGWRAAAVRPEVDAALRGLYAELDEAIARRGPTCWASGKCCKFVEFDHRLYVTGLEVAWFLHAVREGGQASTGAAGLPEGGLIRLPQLAETAGACPYQIGGRCSTHAVRPLGCRVFFCQQGTEVWQQDLYEDFLQRLQGLHEAYAVAYRYLDWIEGLAAAGQTA